LDEPDDSDVILIDSDDEESDLECEVEELEGVLANHMRAVEAACGSGTHPLMDELKDIDSISKDRFYDYTRCAAPHANTCTSTQPGDSRVRTRGSHWRVCSWQRDDFHDAVALHTKLPAEFKVVRTYKRSGVTLSVRCSKTIGLFLCLLRVRGKDGAGSKWKQLCNTVLGMRPNKAQLLYSGIIKKFAESDYALLIENIDVSRALLPPARPKPLLVLSRLTLNVPTKAGFARMRRYYG